MRLLDILPDHPTAERFGDYLLSIGIPNTVEESSTGWSIWVRDDDHLERARTELPTFKQDPRNPKYDRTADARKLRAADEKQSQRLRKKYVDVRTSWSGLGGRSSAVTMTLAGICLLVGVVTQLGSDRFGHAMNWLMFEQISYPDPEHVAWENWGNVQSGQVWRLLTPIFIHYGLIHLVFNLLWLVNLGSAIETRRGMWTLLGLVLVSGVAANSAEYMLDLGLTSLLRYDPSPFFGGMSGVVYALFGYVWMKGKFQSYLGMGVNDQTVMIMIGWLVLCMTPLIGDVANVAHLVGLIVGVIWGYAPVAWRKLRTK